MKRYWCPACDKYVTRTRTDLPMFIKSHCGTTGKDVTLIRCVAGA